MTLSGLPTDKHSPETSIPQKPDLSEVPSVEKNYAKYIIAGIAIGAILLLAVIGFKATFISPTQEEAVESPNSIEAPNKQIDNPGKQDGSSLPKEDQKAIAETYISINPGPDEDKTTIADFSIVDGEQADSLLSRYLPPDEPRKVSFMREIEEHRQAGRKTALVVEKKDNYTKISIFYQSGEIWQSSRTIAVN